MSETPDAFDHELGQRLIAAIAAYNSPIDSSQTLTEDRVPLARNIAEAYANSLVYRHQKYYRNTNISISFENELDAYGLKDSKMVVNFLTNILLYRNVEMTVQRNTLLRENEQLQRQLGSTHGAIEKIVPEIKKDDKK